MHDIEPILWFFCDSFLYMYLGFLQFRAAFEHICLKHTDALTFFPWFHDVVAVQKQPEVNMILEIGYWTFHAKYQFFDIGHSKSNFLS